jgi:hypothetical protein
LGGNLIGISGAGSGNTGFTAATTQTGTVATPLNPQLGALTLNGGPTVGNGTVLTGLLTEVPLPGSPLIHKGVTAAATHGLDERGFLNPASLSGNPTIGAVEFLTPQERFVQALYLDEVGRPGSTAELDGWVGVLGSSGQQAVASGILHSREARDHLVKGWYITFLGRQAQGGEETGFVNELVAGQTEEGVLSQILGSAEFFNRAQTLGFSGSASAQFIQALYQLLLARVPSAVELNGWLTLLPSISLQAAALGFLQSQEYRGDVVTADYTNLLHRAADPVGVNTFASSGMDLGSIRQAFEAGPEFFSNG